MNNLLTDSRVHWQFWGALFALASFMTVLAAQGIFVPGDVTVARTIQGARSIDAITPVSRALYEFGMIPVWPIVTLAVAAYVAMRGQVLGGAFILASALVRPISGLIKEIVERPRPTEAYVRYVEGADGFSFPSGHVFGTVLLVGIVAYILIEREADTTRRWLIAGGAAVMMFLMGVQRVFAGAHWPTDAAAGWLWGGLTLFVLIQVYRAIESRRVQSTTSNTSSGG